MSYFISLVMSVPQGITDFNSFSSGLLLACAEKGAWGWRGSGMSEGFSLHSYCTIGFQRSPRDCCMEGVSMRLFLLQQQTPVTRCFCCQVHMGSGMRFSAVLGHPSLVLCRLWVCGPWNWGVSAFAGSPHSCRNLPCICSCSWVEKSFLLLPQL